MKRPINLLALALTFLSIQTHAALYDRGNGMIYDSTQNITWLQDADYAKTSGYDADGAMNWQDANVWADNLVYGGFGDWRLPSAGLNGTMPNTCPDIFSRCPGLYNGDNDQSFNNTRSEIGHLFFELGNKANWSPTGEIQTDYGVTNMAFIDAITNQTVHFMNIQNNGYWEGESYDLDPTAAWHFVTFYGRQDLNQKYGAISAWAVRDGDVLPVNEVPVPAAAWLMGSSLIGLAGINRFKKKSHELR